MKMNKKLLKVSGGILLVGGIFTTGFFGQQVYTKATTDWQTNAINQANSDLGQAGYDKKSALINGATNDISNKTQQDLSAEVDQQKVDLESLLDQYYQMKLNGLEGTQAYKDIEARIATIKQSIYDRYTKEIDQVFASQTATN